VIVPVAVGSTIWLNTKVFDEVISSTTGVVPVRIGRIYDTTVNVTGVDAIPDALVAVTLNV
jgi:hypothetical protein